MGLDSYILGIGKFNKTIDSYLSYPKEFYKDTQDGVVVTSGLFHCELSSTSRYLAECLDIDVWDFNNHYINRPLDKINSLRAFADNCNDCNDEQYKKDIIDFEILSKNGFKFIFMPEG